MVEHESASNTLSLAFVEGLYADYPRDPRSVPADWRRYFGELGPDGRFVSQPKLGPTFTPASVFSPPGGNGKRGARAIEAAALQERVDQLVRAYRVRGHMVAQVDPLGIPRPPQPELDPAFYGFTEADMDRRFSMATIHGPELPTLRQIIEHLRATYCRSIGVQFMHMDELSVKAWLQARMEPTENRLQLSREEQLRILTRLTGAVIFEEFIQKKYLGAKTFSLEGAGSPIPLLDLAIERAAEQGQEEIVFGMTHRGRLNVLANTIGKSPRDIFAESEDAEPQLHLYRGDVKYHLGYTAVRQTTSGRKMRLSLCFNPSHLEFVDPVAVGRTRAKQDRGAPPEAAAPPAVAAAVERPERLPEAGPLPAPPAVPEAGREEEVVPMSLLRRRVAERLVEAQRNAAVLTTFNEIDMSAVIAVRKQHQEAFQQRYGVKLGFMSFFTKACVDALKRVPQLNAEIRGDDIVYHNYYDIGIAVGGGKGLVVPVLRNAERMSFAEIERAIADLAKRAQENKLKVEELQGGTFTITNGGIYGSLLSTPIVNPPQSGILGMHVIQERPVAREGQVVIRPMMYVALTYDHRIVDGREAVTFLRRVKECIEEPARMVVEV